MNPSTSQVLRIRRLIAAGLLALPALPAAAFPGYHVNFIGDYNFTGRALNDAGIALVANYQTVWLYENGVLTDQGHFGSSSSWVMAADVNDHGVIVGSRASAAGPSEAFVSDHGVVTVIPGMSGASRINDAGQVLGYAPNGQQPVLWTGGALESISFGRKTDTFNASAINAGGQVVGYLSNGGPNQAFVHDHGVTTRLQVPGASYAGDINDLGQIAGWACDFPIVTVSCRGYVYAGGVARFIVPPWGGNSWLSSINNAGLAVGSEQDASGHSRAFQFDGTTYARIDDLLDGDSANWRVLWITDLNNAGQMLAVATRNGLWNEVVLLSPVNVVPEPAAWSLALLGALGLGAWRSRRTR